MNILIGALLVVVFCYACALVYFYLRQEKILFHPRHFPQSYQYSYQWPFEEYFLSPEQGIELSVLKFRTEKPRGLILYLHGNRGHLGKSGSFFGRVCSFGYDVALYDYRHFGKSNGTLEYETLLSDGLFIFDHFAKIYGEENICIHGTSLGSGISSYIASKRRPKQVVLETPYYSIAHVARSRYPFLPVLFVNRFPLSNADNIASIACPVHLIHGTGDRTVPYQSSVMLLALNPAATLHTVAGGDHSDLKLFEDYHRALREIYR